MKRILSTLWRPLATLVLFGVSFGYLEAAVVFYRREFCEPLALTLTPDRKPSELLPLIALEQVKESDSRYLKLWKIEVIREPATIAMLACLGLAVGWSVNTCFAAFITAFGIWDIFYYVFLSLLTDWPTTFPWSIFLAGEAIGLGGFSLALAARDHAK